MRVNKSNNDPLIYSWILLVSIPKVTALKSLEYKDLFVVNYKAVSSVS